MTKLDPATAATVLEDAADLLLIGGRCRGTGHTEDGRLCLVAAISTVVRRRGLTGYIFDYTAPVDDWLTECEVEAARRWPDSGAFGSVAWNDNTADDFEIIDGLRLVAKDLRNGAAA